MRHVDINCDIERHEFAKKAALAFKNNPELASYGDVGAGEYLALRWGLGDDCVLVLKQDEYFEPEIYDQLVRTVKG